jgi:lipoprotein-releasing system permease protein
VCNALRVGDNRAKCSAKNAAAAGLASAPRLWHTAAFHLPHDSPPAVTSYEFFIGLRYTRARQRTRFISVISLISIVGIALGMTVLITVLSVMNGFQREIRTRILGVASHIQLSGADNVLVDWQAVAKRAAAHPEVVATAPYVTAQALLTYGSTVRGVFVRGILPDLENDVSDVGKHMTQGSLTNLKPGEFGIVLGHELARALGVVPGEKIVLLAPQGQVTPAGILPRVKQFTVAGIFRVDHFEYDSGLALIHMEDAQRLFRFGDSVSGVRLKLKDLLRSIPVSYELAREFPPNVLVSDWTMQNANFFRAVQIEKRMMFLIVFLIIAVAAFNIISSLVMAVKDKQSDIAILRTLGAAPRSITKIFLVQGALIGVVGTALGLIGGVALAHNVDVVVPFIENLFGMKFLSKDVYQISELPSDLQTADVVITGIVSLVLTLLATIYPSLRAAKVNPAEALRYE